MSQTEPPDGGEGRIEPPSAPPSPVPALGHPDPVPAQPAAGPVTGWAPGGGTLAGQPAGAGWTPPSPTPPSRGGLFIRRFGVVLVIGLVALGVVGGVVFRDRISGSSSDLVVGDCFDAPSTANTTASTGVEIEDVQHHPCSEPHVYEMFAILKHPAAKGDPYPGTEALFDYAQTNCLPPFATYVGMDFQESVLAVSYIVPQDAGWRSGQRTISCFVGNADDSPVTGSLKGANR